MSLYLQCDNCGRRRWLDVLHIPDGWSGGVIGVAGRLPEHCCEVCNKAGEEAKQAAIAARFAVENEQPIQGAKA